MSDDREQRIREKAFSLWEEGGGEHGRHEEHWRRAEEDVADASGEKTAPSQDQPAEGGAGTPPPKPDSPRQE